MSRFFLPFLCIFAFSLGHAQTGSGINDQGLTDADTQIEAESELSNRGFSNSPEDIRRFQRENGLTETGVLDAETMNSLGVGAPADRPPASVPESDVFDDPARDPMGDPADPMYDPSRDPSRDPMSDPLYDPTMDDQIERDGIDSDPSGGVDGDGI